MGRWNQQNLRRALLLAGLTLGGALAIFWPEQTVTRVRLADGSVLSLQGVSLGTNCSWNYGGESIVHRVGRSLPFGLHRYFLAGTRMERFAFETNLVLWLQRDRARLAGQPEGLRFALVDEQGNQIQAGVTSRQTLSEASAAWVVASPIWPRNARRLTLAVYETPSSGAVRRAGEFTFDNPAPASRKPWEPSPLPSRQETPAGTVVLERFEVRPMPATIGRLFGTNRTELRAFLNFWWTNATAPAAAAASGAAPRLLGVRLWDADGNAGPWEPLGLRGAGNDRLSALGIPLPWPGASAYEIETRWRMVDPTSPPEKLSVTVVMPSGLETMRDVGRARMGAGDVYIVAGTVEEGGRREWLLSTRVVDAPLGEGVFHRVELLGATDEAGRSWSGDARGELRLPPGVGTVTIAAAVYPATVLKFIAEPVRRTNSWPARAR